MRKLLAYVWLAGMEETHTQFNPFQTGFLRKTDASHGIIVLERAGELARMEDAFVCGRVAPHEGLRPHPALLRDHSGAKQKGIRVVARGTRQMVDPARHHQRQTHLLPEWSPARSTRVTSDFRGCFRPRLGGYAHCVEKQKHWVENGQHPPHEHCLR